MSSTDPTALWVCHAIAIALCVARVLLRKVRSQKFTTGDYWTMVALVSIILRATLLDVIFHGGYTTSEHHTACLYLILCLLTCPP